MAASKQAPATALARSFWFRLFFLFTDENSSTKKIEKMDLGRIRLAEAMRRVDNQTVTQI
jgi:hypothetical protein